jgi:hypothetical protein
VQGLGEEATTPGDWSTNCRRTASSQSQNPYSWFRPEHELTSTPSQLFWFDLATLRQHLFQHINCRNKGKDQNAKLVHVDPSTTDNSDSSANNDVPFTKAVSGIDNTNGCKALQDIVWPVAPTADKVGDFKVSPTFPPCMPATPSHYPVWLVRSAGSGTQLTKEYYNN